MRAGVSVAVSVAIDGVKWRALWTACREFGGV
jgi:hypothetical protein